jgi:hypothetical protein
MATPGASATAAESSRELPLYCKRYCPFRSGRLCGTCPQHDQGYNAVATRADYGPAWHTGESIEKVTVVPNPANETSDTSTKQPYLNGDRVRNDSFYLATSIVAPTP